MEVRQIASARQITILNGNNGQIGIVYHIHKLLITFYAYIQSILIHLLCLLILMLVAKN